MALTCSVVLSVEAEIIGVAPLRVSAVELKVLELMVLVVVKVVKAPVEAVVEPIAPGAAKVAPFKELAFKFATLVVEATENGAVPVARVEVS